jgi:hypothetical protein
MPIVQLSSQQDALLLPSAGVQQCACAQRRQMLPVVTQVMPLANQYTATLRSQQHQPQTAVHTSIKRL